MGEGRGGRGKRKEEDGRGGEGKKVEPPINSYICPALETSLQLCRPISEAGCTKSSAAFS